MKLDSARYVLVPIVTAISGALATVGAAYVTDTGFAKARDARLLFWGPEDLKRNFIYQVRWRW